MVDFRSPQINSLQMARNGPFLEGRQEWSVPKRAGSRD
jgi:hypothetical protein